MTIEKLQKSNNIYGRLKIIDSILKNYDRLTSICDRDERYIYDVPQEIHDDMYQYFVDYKRKLEEEFATL